MQTSQPRNTPTILDLKAQGFSDQEIGGLMRLRACYPHLEYVETPMQWNRLTLLQWEYQHGRLHEGETDED